MTKETRAYKAGKAMGEALREMVNLMYQQDTARKFWNGLRSGIMTLPQVEWKKLKDGNVYFFNWNGLILSGKFIKEGKGRFLVEGHVILKKDIIKGQLWGPCTEG